MKRILICLIFLATTVAHVYSQQTVRAIVTAGSPREVQSKNCNTVGTSLTCAFTNNVTAGNTIVVACADNGSGISPSMSDTLSHIYTNAVTESNANTRATIWWTSGAGTTPGTAGGADTITFNPGAGQSSDGIGCVAKEVADLYIPPSSSLRSIVLDGGQIDAESGTAWGVGRLNPIMPNEYVIAVFASAATSCTASGFTTSATTQGNLTQGGTPAGTQMTCYSVISTIHATSNPITANATISPSGDGSGAMASFKPALLLPSSAQVAQNATGLPSPSLGDVGQFAPLQINPVRGSLYIEIRDAGGNNRAAAVDANSNLGVVLPAETTKVVGTVRMADGSGNLTTSTSQSLDTNMKLANGVAPLMGNGATGTGSLRVTIANDSSAIAVKGEGATGSAPPSGAQQIGGVGSGATGGLMVAPRICDTFANIQQTAGAQIITGVASRRIYICSMNLVTATAQNIAVVAGTGTVCATNTVAVPGTSGGTTAATGWNFAANGGIALNGGFSPIAKTTVDADNLCILQSASGQLSGGISYTIQ